MHNASKIPIHHEKYRDIFCRLSLHTYLSVLVSLSELLGHYVHKLPIHHDQCPSSLFSSLLLLQGQGLDFLSSFFGTSWAIQILKICKKNISFLPNASHQKPGQGRQGRGQAMTGSVFLLRVGGSGQVWLKSVGFGICIWMIYFQNLIFKSAFKYLAWRKSDCGKLAFFAHFDGVSDSK